MSNSEIKEDRGFQLAAASDISNKQANTKCLSLKSQSSVNTFIYLRWKQHIIEFKLHHKVVWTFKFALLIDQMFPCTVEEVPPSVGKFSLGQRFQTEEKVT